MKVLLLQIDGKTPNLALMRIATHHHAKGDTVELLHAPTVRSVERGLWDDADLVYASAIFERSRPICKRLLDVFPAARIGGSGWDESVTLEKIGITTRTPDYYVYPNFTASMGYTQRGCRLNCSFCKVPTMEGKVREEATIADIWRGEPWPRNVLLLDNDFFGQQHWQELIEEMRTGGFRVCFNQGINVRILSDEQAAAVASVHYSDDGFKTRRLYTAWDNRGDEKPLFRGLERLVKHGVNPDHILVYMLVGYWEGPKLTDDDLYRVQKLREFGTRPYPMPYVRTRELCGLQRWLVGAYDKRVSWDAWVRAGYEPRNLGKPEQVGLW